MDTIRKADSRRGRIAYEVAGLAWLAEASDPGAPVVPVLDYQITVMVYLIVLKHKVWVT